MGGYFSVRLTFSPKLRALVDNWVELWECAAKEIGYIVMDG